MKTVDGNSMFPSYRDGSNIKFGLDYYDFCDKNIKTGDIIGYNYTGNEKLLMKRVYVTSEDSVSFSEFSLLVNSKPLSNMAGNQYVFTENEKKLLNLYITNKHISTDSFFIFGDNTTNSIDSRKFWAISREDIVWKFIEK
jgi:signal peptidase I